MQSQNILVKSPKPRYIPETSDSNGGTPDMEHFAAVQSIIRAGLAGDREAVDQQVLRLRDRLEKAGESREAATLERLRSAARDTQELAPSRVEMLPACLYSLQTWPRSGWRC